jgi:hypothetical protein
MKEIINLIAVIIFVVLAYGFYTHAEGAWRLIGPFIFLILLFFFLSNPNKT